MQTIDHALHLLNWLPIEVTKTFFFFPPWRCCNFCCISLVCMMKVKWLLGNILLQYAEIMCLFLRIKFTFLVLSTSQSNLTLSVIPKKAVMSCWCPAAVISSRIGTASVGLRRNGMILNFQVNTQWFTVQMYRVPLVSRTLERNYWKVTVKYGCSWDAWGKNPPFYLSQSVCADVLLLHLFLKSRLICCSATWPFFHASVKACT